MKNNSIFTDGKMIIAAFIVLFCGLLQPAFCEADGPALLIQQTPPNGGTITPGTGVHHYRLNDSITLRAIPKAGYQFVYWLGDVSDPTSSSTTVYLNAPKIVVAVFERTEYELKISVAQGIPGSTRGGIRPSIADYSRRGGGGGGGGGDDPPEPPPPPEPPKHDPDIPVPVPEPATVLLLAFGSFFAFARRRPGK